jgi:hypothetical protein
MIRDLKAAGSSIRAVARYLPHGAHRKAAAQRSSARTAKLAAESDLRNYVKDELLILVSGADQPHSGRRVPGQAGDACEPVRTPASLCMQPPANTKSMPSAASAETPEYGDPRRQRPRRATDSAAHPRGRRAAVGDQPRQDHERDAPSRPHHRETGRVRFYPQGQAVVLRHAF